MSVNNKFKKICQNVDIDNIVSELFLYSSNFIVFIVLSVLSFIAFLDIHWHMPSMQFCIRVIAFYEALKLSLQSTMVFYQ